MHARFELIAPTPSLFSWPRPPGRSWSAASSVAVPRDLKSANVDSPPPALRMEAASEFDHVVINDDVDRAVNELAGLIGLE